MNHSLKVWFLNSNILLAKLVDEYDFHTLQQQSVDSFFG